MSDQECIHLLSEHSQIRRQPTLGSSLNKALWGDDRFESIQRQPRISQRLVKRALSRERVALYIQQPSMACPIRDHSASSKIRSG